MSYDDYFTHDDKPFVENLNDALLVSNVFDYTVTITLPTMFSTGKWNNNTNIRKAGVSVNNLQQVLPTGLSLTNDNKAITGSGVLKLRFYPNFNSYGRINEIVGNPTSAITQVVIKKLDDSIIYKKTGGSVVTENVAELSTLQEFLIELTISGTLNSVDIVMKNKDGTRYGADIKIDNIDGIVTVINSSSTDEQIPTAKTIYDTLMKSSSTVKNGHTHGNITNGGAISTVEETFGSQDMPIIADLSASNKLVKGYVPTEYIKDTEARSNIGSAIGDKLTTILNKIDGKISSITNSLNTHIHGNITNDGKITTAKSGTLKNDEPIIADSLEGGKLVKGNIVSTHIKEMKNHSNIGSYLNDNLEEVNDAIDTAIGDLQTGKISTSNTSGLVKNDGSIDTNSYFPIFLNPTITSNDLNNLKDNGIYYISNSSSLIDVPISNLPPFCLVVEGNKTDYIKQTLFNIETNSSITKYRTWVRFAESSSSVWTFHTWTETTVPQSISDLTGVNTSGFVLNNGTIDTTNYVPIVNLNGTSSQRINFNTIIDIGFYTVTGSMDNKPPINVDYYSLIVENVDGNIKQTATSLFGTYSTWYRYYNDNGGTWTNWESNSLWEETILNTSTDSGGAEHTTVLAVNKSIKLCQLYFRQYFGSAQAQLYQWTDSIGQIPLEYRPKTANVYGTIWIGSDSQLQAGTLRVGTNGLFSGKFVNSFSQCVAYATVTWHY